MCIRQIADGVLESIVTYLEQHTIIEQFMNMEVGACKYIDKVKSDVIKDITQKHHVAIDAVTNDAKSGTQSAWKVGIA